MELYILVGYYGTFDECYEIIHGVYSNISILEDKKKEILKEYEQIKQNCPENPDDEVKFPNLFEENIDLYQHMMKIYYEFEYLNRDAMRFSHFNVQTKILNQ